jgi:hypothetical protein
VSGTTGYGGQLGRKGREKSGCASVSRNQLGPSGRSGSDRLGCDSLDRGGDEGPSIGIRLSEGRLGYGVQIRKSETKRWFVGRAVGRHCRPASYSIRTTRRIGNVKTEDDERAALSARER